MRKIKNNTDKELASLDGYLNDAYVNRADLVALLNRADNYALTLLLAPAGSGKSTLLMQWRNTHPELPLAVINLDQCDADPSHFLNRLNSALSDMVSNYHGLSCDDPSVEPGKQSEVLAERLADALSSIKTPLYILVDDFHCADSIFIHEMFAELIARLPHNIHFIVASHTHPRFSLSRLKLDGRAQVIDHHDLRFSESEIMELSERLCPSLAEECRNQLLTMTEGWTAGVKLGLMALSQSATVSEANRVVEAWRRGFSDKPDTRISQPALGRGIPYLNRVESDEGLRLYALILTQIKHNVINAPSMYAAMLASFNASAQVEEIGAAAGDNAAIDRLTTRETDILDLLRQGISNKEISEQSGVAVTTIKWHIKNIFGKLKVGSRAEAIVMANRAPERFGFKDKIKSDGI